MLSSVYSSVLLYDAIHHSFQWIKGLVGVTYVIMFRRIVNPILNYPYAPSGCILKRGSEPGHYKEWKSNKMTSARSQLKTRGQCFMKTVGTRCFAYIVFRNGQFNQMEINWNNLPWSIQGRCQRHVSFLKTYLNSPMVPGIQVLFWNSLIIFAFFLLEHSLARK